MTDRKKPGMAFWATVVMVGLLLYVLSVGPAISVEYHSRCGIRGINLIYRPIFIHSASRAGSQSLLRRYIHLCGVPERWEPMMTDAGIFGWASVRSALHRRHPRHSVEITLSNGTP